MDTSIQTFKRYQIAKVYRRVRIVETVVATR